MSTVDARRFWEGDGAPERWWRQHLAGRLTEHVLESRVLAGNHLGDPTERPLWVYTPPATKGPTNATPPST